MPTDQDYCKCSRCRMTVLTKYCYLVAGQQVCSDCSTVRERDQLAKDSLAASLRTPEPVLTTEELRQEALDEENEELVEAAERIYRVSRLREMYLQGDAIKRHNLRVACKGQDDAIGAFDEVDRQARG